MPKRENGQGTITHLKSGKYRAKIMIEGKEYTKTKSSEQDAKKALKEMIRNQKDLSKNKKYTVEEYINDWLISKKGSIRGKSFDTEEGNCKKIIEKIGYMQLGSVTHNDIQKMIYTLSKEYSLSTIQKIKRIITSVIEKAMAEQLIIGNPIYKINIPLDLKQKEKDIVVLTKEQVRDYVNDAIKTYKTGTYVHRIGYGLVFILFTGIRLSEALALTFDCFNEEERTVSIKHSITLMKNREDKDHRKFVLEENSTKSKKSTRTLYLNDDAWLAYLQLKKLNGEFKHVFSTKTGNIVTPPQLGQTHRLIIKQCNIPKCGIHSLRHTYASLLYDNGVDIKTISELLGHSDTQITYNTYITIFAEKKKIASHAIPLLLDQNLLNTE